MKEEGRGGREEEKKEQEGEGREEDQVDEGVLSMVLPLTLPLRSKAGCQQLCPHILPLIAQVESLSCCPVEETKEHSQQWFCAVLRNSNCNARLHVTITINGHAGSSSQGIPTDRAIHHLNKNCYTRPISVSKIWILQIRKQQEYQGWIHVLWSWSSSKLRTFFPQNYKVE
jgi:hypothetical protein